MNRDSREHLMGLNPAVAELLMEHALDTDDVETSFGMIVMRLGYKATYERILQTLRTNERVMQYKRDPDSLVTVRSGSKKKYSHHTAASVKHGTWNSGLLVGTGAKAQQRRANFFTKVSNTSGSETALNHNIARDKRTADKVKLAAPNLFS